MWLQWWLCMLYLLQVVVLVSMIAGYIYDVSNPELPRPGARPLAGPFELISDRPKMSRAKQSVKMKAIPLSYLRDNLPRVSSRLELVQLFMDTDAGDLFLNARFSRHIRSAHHSPGHGLQSNNGASLQNKETLVHQPESRIANKLRLQSGSSPQENVSPALKGVVPDVDENMDNEDFTDKDYYIDYPQDESNQRELTQDRFEAFEAALHHIDAMDLCSASRCRDPTPFVQSVRDPLDGSRVFLPECVLLHRCMNYSGCCGHGSECVPKSMNIVTRSFLVVDRFSSLDDHVMLNPDLAATVSFVNHTECECREKSKPPACTKACPKPFRLTQKGSLCKCDCFPLANQDDRHCEQVKGGVDTLKHDQLMCINNDNCYTPACTIGEFDTRTGLCPLSDEYSMPALLPENNIEENSLFGDQPFFYGLTKWRAKFAQRDSNYDTRLSQYSHFQNDNEQTNEDILQLTPKLQNSTELSTNQSSGNESESTPEAKLKHSINDTGSNSTNKLAVSYNATHVAAVASTNVNTSELVISADRMSNNMADLFGYQTKSVFEKGDDEYSRSRSNVSTENNTDIVHDLQPLSQVLVTGNAKKASRTPSDSLSGKPISDESVHSKMGARNSALTPYIQNNAIPTVPWFGSQVLDRYSEISARNAKTLHKAKLVSEEDNGRFKSSFLQNILKLQLRSHNIHGKYRSVSDPTKSNRVDEK